MYLWLTKWVQELWRRSSMVFKKVNTNSPRAVVTSKVVTWCHLFKQSKDFHNFSSGFLFQAHRLDRPSWIFIGGESSSSEGVFWFWRTVRSHWRQDWGIGECSGQEVLKKTRAGQKSQCWKEILFRNYYRTMRREISVWNWAQFQIQQGQVGIYSRDAGSGWVRGWEMTKGEEISGVRRDLAEMT